jgi:hypothetical protein
MSTYRFVTSNILTGKILADSLPIVGQSCTRNINSVGAFSGYLPLVTASQDQGMVQNWVNAVIPWQSVLWILQDGWPIWNGPITGWPHQSITDGTLPIQAATMENMFKYRQVATTLTYTNMDIFEIFRQEMQYALNKTPNGQIAGTGKYANTSGVVDTVANSGVLGSITEQASYQAIYDCWNDLITSYGLEYALTPALTDSLSLYTMVQLGLPQMGRLYSATGLQLRMPAQGAVDYAWQWVPTNPANRMVVTGSGAGTNPKSYTGIATSTVDLNAGYPLLEATSSFFGTVTSQAQVNNYATNLLYSSTVTKSLTPMFIQGGDAYPKIYQTMLGDEVMVIATSPLHPATGPQTGPGQGPGVSELLRITGWTLTFPQAQSGEEIQWQLGGTLVGGV